MNFILRPLYQRPEMLYLSIRSEINARKDINNENYHTLFLVEYGADPKCTDIIKDYPFKHTIIARNERMFPAGNILDGLKIAADTIIDDGMTKQEFAINIEEDCLLHDTFFSFIEKAVERLKGTPYSAITTWGKTNTGSPEILSQGSYFCGPGTLINLDFFNRYVRPYAIKEYYYNFLVSIVPVNARNAENPYSKYHATHNNLMMHLDWDGLTNRLLDAALYEEGIYSYSAECFRMLHIGFYGFNRRGGHFPEELKTFEDRVKFLEDSMLDSDKMAILDGSYKDYSTFSKLLDNWSGELEIV